MSRWISRDPVGGGKLYLYVNNRPVDLIDPRGAWAIPPGGVELSGCLEGSFTLAGGWVGAGVASGITLDIVSRVCDCCGPSGFFDDGWVEAGLNGNITLGFGFGVDVEILGQEVALEWHLPEATFNLVDVTVASSKCGDASLNAGDSLDVNLGTAFGAGLGPVAISGGGGINAHAGYGLYVSSAGYGANYDLSVGAELWYTLKLGVEYKVNVPGYPKTILGKTGGVDCTWPMNCTAW